MIALSMALKLAAEWSGYDGMLGSIAGCPWLNEWLRLLGWGRKVEIL
jgi:hypothetical protein